MGSASKMAGRDERQHTGNRNQGGRKQGKAQGGHHHHGANKPVGTNAEQRKALAKVRSVITKDNASDEELLTMLVEHEMEPDKVIQQYYEADGTDGDWAVSTNKRDARKKKLESQEPPRQEHKQHRDQRENREQPRQAHQNGQPRREPREQRGAPNNRPAPAHNTAPANTWADKLRGDQPAPAQQQAPPMPTPMGDHPMGEPTLNAGLDQDALQFGGMPQDMMPPPTGMAPFQMAQLADAMQNQTHSNAPVQQPNETKIADLPESEVNSQTQIAGDLLRSSTMNKNLWSSLVDLWDKRHLVDLKLKPQPGTKRISVHAVVVAAASPTVAEALMSTKKDRDDDRNPPELLVHCDCQALEECVRFCYTGELRVSDDVLANLWYAGSVLEMREVLDLCINWAQTHIHAGNAHTINQLADQYHIPDLKAAVDRYVLTNMQKLVLEPDFVRQPLERITELLSSDDAKFDGELEVFYAVVRWIEHDKAGRAQYLSQLMNTVVRLPQLDFDELEKLEQVDIVAQDPGAQALMHNVYRYLAAPTQRRLAMDIPGSRPRTSMMPH